MAGLCEACLKRTGGPKIDGFLCRLSGMAHMAMGQNPNRTPSERQKKNTKIGPNMGGEFTYQPKWDPKTALTTTATQAPLSSTSACCARPARGCGCDRSLAQACSDASKSPSEGYKTVRSFASPGTCSFYVVYEKFTWDDYWGKPLR